MAGQGKVSTMNYTIPITEKLADKAFIAIDKAVWADSYFKVRILVIMAGLLSAIFIGFYIYELGFYKKEERIRLPKAEAWMTWLTFLLLIIYILMLYNVIFKINALVVNG